MSDAILKKFQIALELYYPELWLNFYDNRVTEKSLMRPPAPILRYPSLRIVLIYQHSYVFEKLSSRAFQKYILLV